jgi:hypothetical protein
MSVKEACHVDEQARHRANSACGGDIAARALGALSGRGDHSRHPRSGRHRYSAAVEILVGWLFLISGIAGLITTFWMRQAPGFWWSLVSAILGIAAGIVLLLWPLSGVLSLTLVLIVFFVSGRWGWMLASGIIHLILAPLLQQNLEPGSAFARAGHEHSH